MPRLHSTFNFSTRWIQLLAILLLNLCLVTSTPAEDKRRKTAQQEILAGNLPRAIELYRELITKNPKDLDARLGVSFSFLKLRNYQEAYNEATRVLEFDPYNARAHALNAAALVRSGYFPRASDHLNIALKINPRDHLALATSAEIDLYENRTPAAYEKLQLVTSIMPSEPDYWLALSRAASRQEQFRQAADALRSFLRYAPKNDLDRRERIEGVIKFYNYLGDTKIYITSGSTTSIPLEIKLRRPYLTLKLNGKAPLRLVVDTGAGVCVISPEAAERIGMKEISRGGSARAVGGEGNFPIVYGLADQVELGNIRVANVPFYIREIHSSPNLKPEERPDGFLGLALLSRFLVALDYKEASLTLTIPGKDNAINSFKVADLLPTTPADDTATLPFRTTEGGLISVETHIDDKNGFNFILDSGASSSVIDELVVADQDWEGKILKEVVKVIGAGGVTENVKLMRAQKVQLTDLVVENLRMPVLSLKSLNEHSGFDQQGILGGDFLQSCRVVIDFQQLKLTITPQNKRMVKRVPNKPLENIDKPVIDKPVIDKSLIDQPVENK
jgi:tetratricopeptide (TPR) repeat protein